jgi:hypothetical protein
MYYQALLVSSIISFFLELYYLLKNQGYVDYLEFYLLVYLLVYYIIYYIVYFIREQYLE